MSVDFDKTFNNNKQTIQLDDNNYDYLIGKVDKPVFRRFTFKFPDKIEWNLDVVKVGGVIEMLGNEFTILEINEDNSLEAELKED